MIQKSDKAKKPASVCADCWKIKDFSFSCAVKCIKFLAHLKVIGQKNGSPCHDYRCGVPGVNDENRELCNCCPIREAYSKSLGKVYKGTQCPLGQERTPYNTSWDYDSSGNKKPVK